MKNKMSIRKKDKLKAEIIELLRKGDLDPEIIISESESADEMTSRLELAKDRLIRIEIIGDYLLVNEELDVILTSYFFKTNLRWSQKVRIFRHHVSERLTVVNKIDLLSEFMEVPSYVKSVIMTLNGLRNAFAHSFFPEDRKRERPVYKGENIYNIETMEKYKEEFDKAHGFLMEKAWGVKPDEMIK